MRSDPTRHIVRRTERPHSETRPVVPELSLSAVHRARDASELDRVYEGDDPGFTYAREGHYNARILADKIARLEQVEAGLICCSGMSATTAVLLACLASGDHIVAGSQLYGRTLRIVTQELPRFGIDSTLVDPSSAEEVENAIRPNTKMILVEVVSNPLLRVADLAGIQTIDRGQDCVLAVDNTFPTPLALRPGDYGADLIIHSVTKLLAGHSDVTLGFVGGSAQLTDLVGDTVVTWGFNASPFDCWLAERGLNTLQVRWEQAQRNAVQLASFLSNHPAVARVFYPGLESHPDHAIAKSILKGADGNMVSFELNGQRAEVDCFLKQLDTIPFAPSLGDVSTMISHPASSSHRALTAQQREKLGIAEGLIRVSVGIEDFTLIEREFTAALR